MRAGVPRTGKERIDDNAMAREAASARGRANAPAISDASIR